MSRITIIASLPVSIVSAGTPKINVFISLVVAASRAATDVIALQTLTFASLGYLSHIEWCLVHSP